MAKLQSKRKFPWSDKIQGAKFTFNLMKPEDKDAILEFTKDLEPDDILFLRMDIRQKVVVDEWVENVRRGRTISVLVRDEDKRIVGYGSLHHNEYLWTSHHGELRIFVLHQLRGIGLGDRLVGEIFLIAREQRLERVIVNIAREQTRVRQVLEHLGFKVEALLTDWLKDQQNRTHDLLILSNHLGEG